MRFGLSGRRGLLWLVLAALVVAVPLYPRLRQAGRPVAPKPPEKSADSGSGPRPADANETGFDFEGTTLKMMTPGTNAVEWELSAKSVEVSQTREVASLAELTAWYHDSQGILSEVRARNVRVEWASRSLRFSGDVEVRARNGARLTTQELSWDGLQGRYLAESGVTFENGATVLTGRKLVADGGLTSVNVSGDVRLKEAGKQ